MPRLFIKYWYEVIDSDCDMWFSLAFFTYCLQSWLQNGFGSSLGQRMKSYNNRISQWRTAYVFRQQSSCSMLCSAAPNHTHERMRSTPKFSNLGKCQPTFGQKHVVRTVTTLWNGVRWLSTPISCEHKLAINQVNALTYLGWRTYGLVMWKIVAHPHYTPT